VVAIFWRGGLAISGSVRLSYTSSMNRARRQAASRGEDIASLWFVQPSVTRVVPPMVA
jgi:hypothetical protein